MRQQIAKRPPLETLRIPEDPPADAGDVASPEKTQP